MILEKPANCRIISCLQFLSSFRWLNPWAHEARSQNAASLRSTDFQRWVLHRKTVVVQIRGTSMVELKALILRRVPALVPGSAFSRQASSQAPNSGGQPWSFRKAGRSGERRPVRNGTILSMSQSLISSRIPSLHGSRAGGQAPNLGVERVRPTPPARTGLRIPVLQSPIGNGRSRTLRPQTIVYYTINYNCQVK